jgi:membrane protein DedA with SNARE-associated domain
MEELLKQFSQLEHWQIAGLASAFLFQGMFMAVFPEEVIITTLGLLWSQGRIPFLEALFSVYLGLLPANAATVFLGSRLGLRLLGMPPFSWFIRPEPIHEALKVVRTYGKTVLFLARFLPLIRGPIYFAAGMAQVGVVPFAKIDFLASLIQVPALLFLGYEIGRTSTSLVSAYQKIFLVVGLLFVAVLSGRLLVAALKHRGQQGS